MGNSKLNIWGICTAILVVFSLQACGGGGSNKTGPGEVTPTIISPIVEDPTNPEVPVPGDPVITTYYIDADGDGFGNPEFPLPATSQPAGYVTNSADCDDHDATITEDCGENKTWYIDDDVDGFGDATHSVVSDHTEDGYVPNADDCDDADAEVNPKADENCTDEIDNDCNGDIDSDDEACSAPVPPTPTETTYYKDSDGDTYGDAAGSMSFTDAQDHTGYVLIAGDCDDDNSTVYVSAPELCDGLDNDCDGVVDAGCPVATTYYLDADGDGYGDASNSKQDTSQPSGYVTNADDCDDTSSLAHPGKTEASSSTCNDTFDNDCDGYADLADIAGCNMDGDEFDNWSDLELDEDGDGLPNTIDICDTKVDNWFLVPRALSGVDKNGLWDTTTPTTTTVSSAITQYSTANLTSMDDLGEAWWACDVAQATSKRDCIYDKAPKITNDALGVYDTDKTKAANFGTRYTVDGVTYKITEETDFIGVFVTDDNTDLIKGCDPVMLARPISLP